MKTLQQTAAPMTWARLIGLIQADGNFYFSVDSDQTLRPKVTVTVTGKRELLIRKIHDFLIAEGFKPQTNMSDDNTRTTNIVIERIDQCERLLEKINLLEISLVGQKKLDCEILKQVIHLNNNGKAIDGSRTLEAKLKLVDLKDRLSAKPLEKNDEDNESANTLAKRFGITDWKSSAQDEWTAINDKTTRANNTMIDLSAKYKGNSKDIPQALGEFVSGLWCGDGSFQISVKSHQAPDGGPVIVRPKNKPPWKRRFIEIKPETTLTAHEQSSNNQNPLYIISENLFSSKTKKSFKVSRDKKAARYYIKSVSDINEYVIPFFERFPPSYERALYRFRTFRFVAQAYEKIRNSPVLHKRVVKFLFSSPFFGGEEVREKTYDEYMILINKQFNRNKSS